MEKISGDHTENNLSNCSGLKLQIIEERKSSQYQISPYEKLLVHKKNEPTSWKWMASPFNITKSVSMDDLKILQYAFNLSFDGWLYVMLNLFIFKFYYQHPIFIL